MNEEVLNQEVVETETQAEENPYEKLSIAELEILLVDSEQIIKVTKQEIKDHERIGELADQIKAHRGDPKWAGHKEKLEGIKERAEELKEEKSEINAEIDEEISEELAEKTQLEAPYREIIKGETLAIKQILDVLQKKGRVVNTEETKE